jgi:lysophospholipase L1-like esterase
LWLGDSLTVQEFITGPLRQDLIAQYGNAGVGWNAFYTGGGWPLNMTMVSQGTWTERDQVPGAFGLNAYDCNTTDTATPASRTLTGAASVSDRIVFHYIKQPGGGSLRYRVDAGSWTTISTANATTVPATITISGLPLANHDFTVEIVTAGTAGISPLGADFQIGKPGVRFHMMGNTGSRLSQWAAQNGAIQQQIIAALAPDLVGIQFSTNEQSNLESPPSMVAAYTTMIGRSRAAVPNVDIVLATDPDTANSSNPSFTPTVEYSVAVQDLARSLGVGFMDFYKVMGDYPSANALGLYGDTVHPNAAGGKALADFVYGYINDGIGSPFFGGTFINGIYQKYDDNNTRGYHVLDATGNVLGSFSNSGNTIAIKFGALANSFKILDTNLNTLFQVGPTGAIFNPGNLQVGGAIVAGASGIQVTDGGGKILSGAINTVQLAQGGTGAILTDPNVDRLMFWDDSDGGVDWLTIGSGLTITGKTLSAANSGAPVASAATIVPSGTSFHVTGTTGISAINCSALPAGTELTIIFDGALTLTHSTSLRLAGSTNFTTTADTRMRFHWDGSVVREVGDRIQP